jgi:hypothetical protein
MHRLRPQSMTLGPVGKSVERLRMIWSDSVPPSHDGCPSPSCRYAPPTASTIRSRAFLAAFLVAVRLALALRRLSSRTSLRVHRVSLRRLVVRPQSQRIRLRLFNLLRPIPPRQLRKIRPLLLDLRQRLPRLRRQIVRFEPHQQRSRLHRLPLFDIDHRHPSADIAPGSRI